MSAPVMRLDFAGGKKRPGTAAMLILALGVLSLVVVLESYREIRAEADGLALRYDELSSTVDAAGGSADSSSTLIPEAEAVIDELSTPWGLLLGDLEAANTDSSKSVAVLAVEPDREHHKVKISGESRTLPEAFAYAERLQKSTALRYPLLDSHEVQTKDQYRPVRFQITASWRVGP